jgi:hypothetical protein
MADISASLGTSPLGKVRLISDHINYTEQGACPFPILLSKQGGMGFQFEGGLITVVATSPKVQITFDRPMTYGGAHTHNPTGPFDIGTPSLTADALALDVPINVANGTVTLLTASMTDLYNVTMSFDGAVNTGSPALAGNVKSITNPTTSSIGVHLSWPNVVRITRKS